LAVSFSDNNDIEVVDLTSGKTAELPRASSHPYFVNSIAFDATGDRLLVCYNDGGAWEWSLAHGAARDGATFEGAFPDPSPVAVGLDAQFSANGQAVLLADNLGNIAVYATKTRRLAEELNAGDGLINTAMFSPDGSTILTAGDDGTMRLWNLASRTQLAIFGPSDEPFVTAVNTAVFGTFSAGPAVISGGNDGYIRVWSAEAATPTLSQLERAARDRVTRSYTPAERTEFLSS
jgi:WD40 repeat protein